MSVRLEACAKVFLAGEYAVLDRGRPALVVGIDRKVHATADRSGRGLRIVHAPTGASWDGGTPPPELRFAARAAELALRFCGGGGDLSIVFEDDLALDGRKLGLGGARSSSNTMLRSVCATSARAVGM